MKMNNQLSCLLFISLLSLAICACLIGEPDKVRLPNLPSSSEADDDNDDDNEDDETSVEDVVFKLPDEEDTANGTTRKRTVDEAYNSNKDSSVTFSGNSPEQKDYVADEEEENDQDNKESNNTDVSIIKKEVRKIARLLSKVQPAGRLEKLLKKYNGTLIATVDKQDEHGPVMHVKGIEQFWQSKDGKTKLQGSGYYNKRYNNEKGREENRYGAKLSLLGPLLQNDTDNDGTSSGSLDIGLNRLNSQGAQLSFETSQDLWQSADGEHRLKGEAYYKKQFGSQQTNNQYDNIGGQLTYEGRPNLTVAKRLIEFKDPVKGRVRLDYEHDKGSDVLVEANGKLWSNDNETASLNGKAFYKQNFGKLAGQSYDTRLTLDKDDLKMAVDIKKDLYQAPQLNLDLSHKLWKSPNGKDEFEANAYYVKNFENTTANKSDHQFGFRIVLNHVLNN